MPRVPRRPEPRIVDPATHQPRLVNFSVAAEFLSRQGFPRVDHRAIRAWVEQGELIAKFTGRRQRIDVDELVRFTNWLRRHAASL